MLGGGNYLKEANENSNQIVWRTAEESGAETSEIFGHVEIKFHQNWAAVVNLTLRKRRIFNSFGDCQIRHNFSNRFDTNRLKVINRQIRFSSLRAVRALNSPNWELKSNSCCREQARGCLKVHQIWAHVLWWFHSSGRLSLIFSFSLHSSDRQPLRNFEPIIV